jgi:hypothetical protein
MAGLFDSPRLTLERADHHIRDFADAVDGFTAKQSWTYFVDQTSSPGRDLHKIRFHPLPKILPCILFDAANNLRAVLDQIGYASAVSAQSPSLKNIKFPFGPSAADFKNNVAGRCKDVPDEIRAIFEASNAYPGGNDTLWAINEIANTNKHLLSRGTAPRTGLMRQYLRRRATSRHTVQQICRLLLFCGLGF